MNITDLIKLEERATAGPWVHDGQVFAAATREEIASWIYEDADAAFIVALRNAWPRLRKVVEAADDVAVLIDNVRTDECPWCGANCWDGKSHEDACPAVAATKAYKAAIKAMEGA